MEASDIVKECQERIGKPYEVSYRTNLHQPNILQFFVRLQSTTTFAINYEEMQGDLEKVRQLLLVREREAMLDLANLLEETADTIQGGNGALGRLLKE